METAAVNIPKRATHIKTTARSQWKVKWCVRVPATQCSCVWLSVCVWNIWIDVKLLPDDVIFAASQAFVFSRHDDLPISNLEQGAQAHCGYLCQRSYSTMGKAEIDPLRAPAIFQFIVNGNRLSLEPASRFDFHFISFLRCCRNLEFYAVNNDCLSCIRTSWFI